MSLINPKQTWFVCKKQTWFVYTVLTCSWTICVCGLSQLKWKQITLVRYQGFVSFIHNYLGTKMGGSPERARARFPIWSSAGLFWDTCRQWLSIQHQTDSPSWLMHGKLCQVLWLTAATLLFPTALLMHAIKLTCYVVLYSTFPQCRIR